MPFRSWEGSPLPQEYEETIFHSFYGEFHLLLCCAWLRLKVTQCTNYSTRELSYTVHELLNCNTVPNGGEKKQICLVYRIFTINLVIQATLNVSKKKTGGGTVSVECW
jgi:hypothetical protein